MTTIDLLIPFKAATASSKALRYYYENHEKIKARGRKAMMAKRHASGGLTREQWYAKSGRGLSDSERKAARCRSATKWRRTHPDKAKARDFVNNSRRRGFDVRHPSEAIRQRLLFFGNRCVDCGSTTSLEVDHIKPLSKGGSNLPSNFCPRCKICNLDKHAYWHGPQAEIKRRDYWLSLTAIQPRQRPAPSNGMMI